MQDQYFIPHNFKDNGKILGMFDKKNTYKALVWWVPATVGLFALPISLTIKCFLEILLVFPPAIIILLGYLDLLTYMRDHKAKAGEYQRRDQEQEETEKQPKRAVRYRDIVPVARIKSGVVTRTDGNYVHLLCVSSVNFRLKSKLERSAIILGFEEFLRSLNLSFQLTVLTQKADIEDYFREIERRRSEETSQHIHRMMDSYRALGEALEQGGAVTHRFVLSYEYPLGFKQKPEDVSIEAVQRYFADMDERIGAYLKYCGNDLLMDPDRDFQTAQVLNTALCRNNYDFEPIDGSLWGGLDSYVEHITPKSINTTSPNHIRIDDKYVSTIVIAWIPYKVGAGWLEDLIAYGEGVNVSVHYRAGDPNKLNHELNMAIGGTTVKKKHAGENQADLDIIENSLEHARYIRKQMSENKSLYFVTVLVSVSADSAEKLEKQMKDVESKISSKGMIPRRCDFLQTRAYVSTLPLCSLDKILQEMGERNMLSDGTAASYPFSSFELSDRGGIIWGENEHNHSLISADMFNTKRHLNGNAIVLGVSGSGKTMLIHSVASRFRILGIPVTMVVPLKGWEYKNICDVAGFQYIKLSPGTENIFNLMEIRPIIRPDNESLLMRKLYRLGVIFGQKFREGMSGGMTLVERELLDDKILQVYEKAGITVDNGWARKKKVPKMPTLMDLYGELIADEETKRVGIMLRRMINGVLRCLNGQTNVEIHSDNVVIDISDFADEELSVVMNVVVELTEDRASLDPSSKKAIMIDELWRLVGSTGTRKGAELVLRFYKAIRGMGGIVITSTQDVTDLFAVNNGEFGEALINNSNFKIIMHNEDLGVDAIAKVVKLSEEEKSRITSFPQGHGLFYSGSSHVAFHFRPSEAEYRLFSTDRSDLERWKREAEETGEA